MEMSRADGIYVTSWVVGVFVLREAFGAKIAAFGSFTVGTVAFRPGWAYSTTMPDTMIMSIVGGGVGLLAFFLPVWAVCLFVDLADDLMQTKADRG